MTLNRGCCVSRFSSMLKSLRVGKIICCHSLPWLVCDVKSPSVSCHLRHKIMLPSLSSLLVSQRKLLAMFLLCFLLISFFNFQVESTTSSPALREATRVRIYTSPSPNWLSWSASHSPISSCSYEVLNVQLMKSAIITFYCTMHLSDRFKKGV